MLLDPAQVQTKEVLGWEGLHLLNFSQSSCSQKVRILLREKGLPYRSRVLKSAVSKKASKVALLTTVLFSSP